MSLGIDLIIGLGNPGAEYAQTRHNAGAWFVANIALANQLTLRKNTKCNGMHGLAEIQQKSYHLFIANTFMNHSGQSVKAILDYYKIPPNHLLVAHDDIDLPVGSIKLKLGGGHGGHNGLRSIIDTLGTTHFYRLRIGVGRPTRSSEVADYVLHAPSKSEAEKINKSLEKALMLLPDIITGNFPKIMQVLHTEEDNL